MLTFFRNQVLAYPCCKPQNSRSHGQSNSCTARMNERISIYAPRAERERERERVQDCIKFRSLWDSPTQRETHTLSLPLLNSRSHGQSYSCTYTATLLLLGTISTASSSPALSLSLPLPAMSSHPPMLCSVFLVCHYTNRRRAYCTGPSPLLQPNESSAWENKMKCIKENNFCVCSKRTPKTRVWTKRQKKKKLCDYLFLDTEDIK